jgi:hypothetical protein
LNHLWTGTQRGRTPSPSARQTWTHSRKSSEGLQMSSSVTALEVTDPFFPSRFLLSTSPAGMQPAFPGFATNPPLMARARRKCQCFIPTFSALWFMAPRQMSLSWVLSLGGGHQAASCRCADVGLTKPRPDPATCRQDCNRVPRARQEAPAQGVGAR